MATYEATGTGTTGASSYTLRLVVNEDSYSISNNTSSVSWALYLISTGYNFSTWSFPITCNVDGEVYNASEYRTLAKNSTLLIASGSKTIAHNNDGTKSISCSATVRATGASYLPGNIDVSGTLVLTNIPRYANFTSHYISSTALNSISVHWGADANCDWVQYSLNGGAWINTAGTDYTISGLVPNTQYNIRTRIRRTDSQLWTTSGYIYGTTKDIAKVSSYSNFNLGDNTSVSYTNPSGNGVLIGIYATDASTPYVAYRIPGKNPYTFNFTDEELDIMYKAMGKANSLSALLYLRTTGDTYYYDVKPITVTLTGNQKTGKINVNGSWKRTKKWVNVSDSWKRCVRWVNVNEYWKRCA